MVAIPEDERQRYEQCFRRAWLLARAGQVEQGYAELDLGLTWAQTPPIHPFTCVQEAPEPWSEALTALYQSELVRYVEAHCPAGPPALECLGSLPPL